MAILNVGSGEPYTTIQAALAAAVNGDTIMIANGTYSLGASTLNIDKTITIIGESEAGVILDASGIDGYGIFVTADGASFSNFTLNGPATGGASGNYGFKAGPDTGDPTDILDGLSVSHVTVSNSGRAEFDLNGVINATLSDVTANGMGTGGHGIALTDCANVTLHNIATSYNVWGSVALYPTNRFYDEQLTNIQFTGTYTANELIKIQLEDASNGISGDGSNEVNGVSTNLGTLTLPSTFASNHGYQVQFAPASATPLIFYFATEAEADALLATLTGPQKQAALLEAPNGDYLVKNGMSIQLAIDASGGGETIKVYPGTYVEAANYNPTNNTNDPGFTNPLGLLVNKSVTIQGVDASGAAITDSDDVAATVTAAVESNWGTSFFVTASDVTITGLSFIAAAPGGTVNKAFEIVEDNFTLAYSVVGSVNGDIGSTIYVNDDVASASPSFVSDISSFNIHDNVLNGDFVLANGAGFGIASPSLVLADNEFVRNPGSTVDWNWGVIITGKDDAVAWRVQSVGPLIATGNSFSSDYTTDRLLFVRDDSSANLPSAQFVEDFIANNGVSSYAYATSPSGVPSSVELSTTNAFVLALTAGNGSSWANPGDTLIVKTDGFPATETIVTNDLDVNALSANLDLELGGGVVTLALLGTENTDVTGNALANTITGNSAANTLTGGDGADVLQGGGGADAIVGGEADALNDVALYAGTLSSADIVQNGAGGWTVTTGTEGTDTLSGVEIIQHAGGRFLLVGNGGFADYDAAAAFKAGLAGLPTDVILVGDINLSASGTDIDVEVSGGDSVVTGSGNDTVGADTDAGTTTTIATGDGDDEVVVTGSGDAVVNTSGTVGGSDVDDVTTGSGNDTISTGADTDTIDAGAGDDTIDAGSGNDIVDIGDGDDAVYGGEGNDTIIAGNSGGDDLIIGGSGTDTVTFPSLLSGESVTIDLRTQDRSANPAIAAILNDSGNQTLLGTAGYTAPVSGWEDLPVGFAEVRNSSGVVTSTDVLLSIENATGSSGNDTFIEGAGTGNNVYNGAGGSDTVDYSSVTTPGSGVVLTFVAGGSATGVDTGTDTFVSIENAVGTQDDDQLTGSSAANTFRGEGGNDFIQGGGGIDTAQYVVTTPLSGIASQSGTFLSINDGVGGVDTLLSVERLQISSDATFGNADDKTFIVEASGNIQILTEADTGAVTEAGGVANGTQPPSTSASVTGNVTSNDIELESTETKTVTQVVGPSGTTPISGSTPVTGTYGVLTIDSTGAYTYALTQGDTDTNALTAGQVVTETFTYTVTDGTSPRTATLTVTITGTNDTPVANAAATTVVEDASITGSVTGTDADTGETATLSYALVDPAPAGLTFNGDGSYTFDASSYDSIPAGSSTVLTIPFTVTDTSVVPATSSPANLVITITGTNDTPVANAAATTVVEDASITGSVTGTDADTGETATLSYALVDPAPAGLTFNGDGSYTFDASSYDSIPAGSSTVLTIPFTVTDTSVVPATSSPANLVITITGTNDTPVANAAATTVVEDASITGSVTGTDADTGETATLSYALVDPAPAGLTFNGDGSYTFDASSYDSIPAGSSTVLTIPFTVTDTSVVPATSSPANLVITITGTNDTPVANAAATTVVEDASITGSVTGTDADTGETATLSYALVDPAPAGLTFNGDGSYTFDASSYDSIPAGSSTVLTIPFTVTDTSVVPATSSPANLVITITGTNDAVSVTGVQTGSVIEDAVPASGQIATGVLTASDPDSGESGFIAGTVNGTYGSVIINASGAWSYSLNGGLPATTQLAQGAIVHDLIAVETVDGTDVVIDITVTGTNDGPVIAGIVSSTVNEYPGTGLSSATIDLLAGTTDVDAGATLSVVAGSGNLGALPAGITLSGNTLTVDTNHASFNTLAQGATQTILVTYQVTDGIAPPVNQTALITVTGANDVPTVTGALTASGTEDTGPLVVNLLTGAADVDVGDVLSVGPISGLPAGVTQVGNLLVVDTNAFPQGLTATTIPYTILDGRGGSVSQSVQVTVTNVNDAPVAVASVGAATEPAVPTPPVTGSVSATDVDSTSLTFALVGLPPAGLAFNSNGTWSFDASSYDSLANGQQLVLVIPFTANDGTATSAPANLTITITGTNDAPTVTALTAAASEGGASVAVNGLLGATNGGDGGSLSVIPGSLPAGVTFAAGTFTLDPTDASFNSLAAGATTTVTVNYSVSDNGGLTSVANQITFTVIGTNDGATIGGVVAGTVTEDGTTTATGALTITDADTGQNAVVAIPALTAGDNGYGTFSVAANGAWEYTLTNGLPAVQALGVGQTLTDRITVTSADGSDTQVITVTIEGANDGAAISGTTTGTVIEDTTTVVAGMLSIADVDAGQAAVVAIPSGAGTYGTFAVSANGAWTYTLTNSDTTVQALRGNQSLTDSIVVTSADGTDTETITITINGSNDRPTVTAATAAVTENGSIGGTLSGSDIDNGHATNLTFEAVGTLPAGLAINSDGTWTFDADTYESLGDGQSLVLVVPFTATDPSTAVNKTSLPATLTITITGDNDAPTVTAQVATATEGGAEISLNALATASDVDGGTLSVVGVPGSLPAGVQYNVGTQTFSFDPTVGDYDDLAVGVTENVSVTYGIYDGFDTTTTSVTFTVVGTNDAPVAASAVVFPVPIAEGASFGGTIVSGAPALPTEIPLSAFISDVDGTPLPSQLTFTGATINGTPVATLADAGITYNPGTGVFSIVTAGVPEYEALVLSTTANVVISFTSTDAQGATSNTGTVQFTVTGTNDVPTVTAGAASVLEDALLTGAVVGQDTDAGETATLTYAVVGLPPAGLTFHSNGSYSFDASSYDSLAAGATQVLTIPFTATDAQGAISVSANLTITITGTNDGAAITGTVSGTVTEDSSTTVSGALTIADVDAGQDAVQAIVAGTAGDNGYGTFSVAANGAWEYTLTNGLPAVQALGMGQTLTDRITVTSADGTATQVITVTITGTNGMPVVGSAVAGVATEDTGVFALNLLAGATDEEGQTLSVMPSVMVTAITVGGNPVPGFIPDTAASMGFQLIGGQLVIDTNAPDIDLQAGEVAVLTFEYSVTDTDGGVTSQTATFTLTGVNDAPTATGVETETATEGGGTVALNLLGSINDEDHDETFTVVSTSALPAGFTMTPTGVDFDTDDAAYNGLAAGQTQVVSFNYTVEDATGASVTQTANVTITGTNDGPVATTVTELLREDSVTATYGTLFEGVTDPDTGAALSVNGVTATGGVNGLISVTNPFVLAGVVYDQIFIGQYGTLAYASGAAPTPTQLGQGAFANQTQFTGQYQYFIANQLNSIQQLTRNPTTSVTDTFTFNVSDGTLSTSQTLNFTIRGNDDGLTVRNDFLTANEGNDTLTNISSSFSVATGAPTITPTAINLLANDYDLDASQTAAITVTSFDIPGAGVGFAAGSSVTLSNGAVVSVAANGDITFTQNGAYDSLGQFDVSSVVLFYNVSTPNLVNGGTNGTTGRGTVELRVTGTNDEPTVSAVVVSANEGDASLTVSALTGASDVDIGDTLTVIVPPIPTWPAGVTYNDLAGEFTFDPSDAAYDHLAAGDTEDVVVNFHVTDGNSLPVPHTITFHVVGMNDGATIAGFDAGSVAEDAVSTSDALTISDVDDGEAVLQAIPAGTDGDNGYGTFEVQSDGDWTYTLDNGLPAVQALGVGDTLTDRITVTSEDGTATRVITVTITGTNDGATITGDLSGNVSEDASPIAAGLLTIADVDSGEDAVIAIPAGAGTYGTFEVAANGGWTYTLNSALGAVQELGVGETLSDSIVVTSADGTATETIEVTITGTNDVPVVGTATAAVDEDATISGSVSGTDADANDTLTYGLVAPAPAGLTFNPDGTWDFDADSYDSLADGATMLLSVAYYANDGTVNSPAGVLEITITGTNDGPSAVAQTATAIEDGAAVSVDGLAGASDGGDGGALTVSYLALPDGVSEAGGVFTLDPSHASFQSLAAGATATVTVNYDVEDGVDSVVSSITFTVVGTNDGATIGGVTSGLMSEDTPTVGGTLTISDDDTGETTVVEILAGTPGDNGHGTFEVLANGDWEYTLDTGAAQALGDSETLTDRITVTSFDGSETQVIEVTITGTNDAPVVTAVVVPDLSEDTGTVIFDLLDGIADAENQALTVSNVLIEGDPPPSFVTLSGGQLVIDSNAAAIDGAEGEAVTLSLTYDVTDAQGETVPVSRTFTFNGANDAPTISAPITAPDATEGVAGLVTINALTNVVELDTSPVGPGITGVLDQLTVIPPGSLPAGVTFDAGVPGVTAPTFTLDPTDAAFDFLADGQTHTIVVDYEVTDGVAAPVPHQAVFRVIGTNDTPTGVAIGGNASGAITMLEHTPGIVGTLTTADADSTTFTYQIVGGVHAGLFTLGGTNGDQLMVASNTTLDFERDGAGPLNVIVRTTDGNGATFDKTLAISIGNVAIDNVIGGASNEVIHGGASADILYGLGGNDTLVGNDSTDQLYGGDGNDGMVGGGGADIIAGGIGEDWAVGGDGADAINGDAGHDVLYGNAGEDWIVAGDGNDFIDGGSEADVIYGNLGADGVFGGTGNDYISGGEGNDTLLGQGGNDGIFGGSENDYIYGGIGNDSLLGEAGVDVLYGEADNDSIDGGAEGDLITGGLGQDFLTGGAGGDTFIFEDGDSVVGSADYLMDWQNGSDFISLRGIATATQLSDLTISQSGTSVVITDSDDLQIIVLNANAGDFDAADFYFNP